MSFDNGRLARLIKLGAVVRVFCSRCRANRDIDLEALAAKVGSDYSLWNRRCRCRMMRHCKGWNRFRSMPGAVKLYDAETQARWDAEDWEERQRE
jgi:hypothetical protein